jgi:3-isopropylmalate/(R)-2-methylmalate dehydratase small subunit
MDPFTTFTSVAVPLDEANIDTDQIIPAEFLRKPRSAGFGRFLFHRRRFASDGQKDPRFPLNRVAYRAARILVTNANFGCGSSRESAVWALIDPPVPQDATGAPGPGAFRSIVAPSFGDIFYSNAAKNGLLCVRLGENDCARIREQLRHTPGASVTVDLVGQQVTGPDGVRYSFEIDPFRKECLLKGLDDIDLTLGHSAAIHDWELRTARDRSWMALSSMVAGG